MEFTVRPEIACAFLPGTMLQVIGEAGVATLTEPVPAYAYAEDGSLRTSIWLTPLLEEAAARSLGPAAPTPGQESHTETVIWDVDTKLGVLVPAASRLVEEPPPFR
jgi:hypothetical protein